MTRFMLVDLGVELTDATVGALVSAASPVPLRLIEGQIIHVRPGAPGAARSRDVLLCRRQGDYYLRPARGGARPEEEALGHVVAIGQGPASFSLERGLLRLVPFGWLPRAVAALEVLSRFQ